MSNKKFVVYGHSSTPREEKRRLRQLRRIQARNPERVVIIDAEAELCQVEERLRKNDTVIDYIT